MTYLLKILFVLMFGLVVILTYYFGFSFHQESFSGSYVGYVFACLILYGMYKSYQIIFSPTKISFSFLGIVGFALLHIFVLSILFYITNETSGGVGLSLFFNIISYLILPAIIVLLSMGFGKKLLSFIPDISQETSIFQNLLSLGLGFVAFVSAITIFGMVGFYNFFVVSSVAIVFFLFSYKEIIGLLQDAKKDVFQYQSDENSLLSPFFQLRLISGEFFFFVITFLIGVNLINIVRPMPIGWDDLGVYMNFPQLLSQAGEIIPLGGMYAWQVFTGIGFMLQSPTQAFFLNNLGGILSVIVIVFSLYDLFNKKSKTFLNIPLMAGAMFLSMPMVIFQQAKDMKLDPGLFFISTIALYGIFYIFLKYLGYKEIYKTSVGDIVHEKTPEGNSLEIHVKKTSTNSFLEYFSKYEHFGEANLFEQKKYLLLLGILGIILGFAFSIKVTSLLLISGILGVIVYSKIGIAGFFGYVSLYFGIFTKLGLWDMMNVVYPKDDSDFRMNFFVGSILISFLLFGYAFRKYGAKAFSRLGVMIGVLLVGIGIGVSPWIVNNIIDTKSVSVSSILSGKGDYLQIDYSKILSDEEKKNIDDIYTQNQSISASGTTTNEDWGRYFGYETGINNYVKLPFNLTMQVNQRGEFTDITYLFLALLPGLLLFLSYKSKYFAFGPLLWAFVFLVMFFAGQINVLLEYFYLPALPQGITNFSSSVTFWLSSQILPVGYMTLFLFCLIPFVFLMYSLDRSKLSMIFKINGVFAFFYVFLWTISAYGVVWYGIVMYYSFLVIIAIGTYYITRYDIKMDEKTIVFRLMGTFVVFFLVSIYTFQSTFPHGMNNLKNASYMGFKASQVDKYSAIFDSQMRYYDVLVELNIAPEKRQELFQTLFTSIQNVQLKSILENNKISDLQGLNLVLTQLAKTDPEANNLELNNVIAESKKLRQKLYKNVLYPQKDLRNPAYIYRIGTFLKYFIADNNTRLLEDSLIYEFDKYFYDEKNVDVSLEKMKKVGLSYFLVDLNAATIDRDARRALTKRYESLLNTFRSDKVELITTDSLCLQTALEVFQSSEKTQADLDNYMKLAGVNYESYDESGNLTLNRNQKLLSCYEFILEQYQNNTISETSYSHLYPFKKYLDENPPKSNEELVALMQQYIPHGYMVLFKIK